MPKSYMVEGTEYRFPDDMNDQQVHDVLLKQGVIKPPPAQHWADTMGLQNPIARGAVDLAEGAAAGFASTIYQGGDLIRRAVGKERIINKPEVQAQMTAPDSLMGKAGKFIEQGAEYVLPGAAATKLTKGAGLAARAGAQAAAAGVTSAVQTGGDPGATAAGVAAGAAGPVLGAAARGAGRAVALPLIEKVINSSPRPLSDAAKTMAAKYGVPLTRGMEGGSRTVQAAEKTLGHTVAPDLYEAVVEEGQQGVRRMANDLAGNFSVDKFAAGDNTVQRVLSVAGKHKESAQKAYGALEAIEADPANLKTITTGMKPSAVLDASGNPVMTPVVDRVALPVDVTMGKKRLLPIRDFIKQQLPVAQQQYSKGLHAVEQFIAGPDVVPASVAEANLSALKQIQREAVDGKVKALAGQVIDSLSPAVDSAVSAAGPDAIAALRAGRQSWKAHAQALDLVDSLSGDITGKTGQVTAAQRLLKPGDAAFPLIRDVLKVAPESADDLGKALIGQIFSKAENGSVTNALTASNLWNRIGTRTKAALFTPEHMKDVTAALELAKRVNENPNPSGTGVINGLLKLGVLVTHPVQGGAAISAGRTMAKILYEPQGAAALKTALRGGPPGQAGKALMTLRAIIAKTAESAGEGRGQSTEGLTPAPAQ